MKRRAGIGRDMTAEKLSRCVRLVALSLVPLLLLAPGDAGARRGRARPRPSVSPPGGATATPEPTATPTAPPPLSAIEAAGAVGRTRTVCGTVAASRRLALSAQRLTFLNLDRPHPDSPFTVVIRPEDRSRFPEPPEQAFFGRRICATGMIEIHRGQPQIVAREPGQIRLEPAAPATGAIGLPAAAGR